MISSSHLIFGLSFVNLFSAAFNRGLVNAASIAFNVYARKTGVEFQRINKAINLYRLVVVYPRWNSINQYKNIEKFKEFIKRIRSFSHVQLVDCRNLIFYGISAIFYLYTTVCRLHNSSRKVEVNELIMTVVACNINDYKQARMVPYITDRKHHSFGENICLLADLSLWATEFFSPLAYHFVFV